MRSLALATLLLTACSGSDDPPALGPLMPQAVPGNRNAVIASPTVMPITWDGDANRTDIEAFIAQYAASPAWAIQTAEYGIGPLTAAPPQHVTGNAPITDADVRTLLSDNLSGPAAVWGAPSEDTVYSVFLPSGTALDDGTGAKCCVVFDGYHDDVIIDGLDVAYAVLCACDSSFTPPGITPLQELTAAASHEIVESVTDPRLNAPAYDDVDAPHEVWTYVTDGELADLCEFTDTAFWTNAPNMTYTIQRIWSNAAAHAGTDPCVGDPTTPYYQAVPDQLDNIAISPFGQSVASKGTKVAVGATGTITVQLAGTPGSGPFTITAQDVATLYFNATTPLLTFVQPAGPFHLGDTVTIQTTVKATDSMLGGNGAEAFEIDTTPVNGGPTTFYYGLIGQ